MNLGAGHGALTAHLVAAGCLPLDAPGRNHIAAKHFPSSTAGGFVGAGDQAALTL
ncbi:hypothetical protein ABMK89_09730 [Mycobacteroides abscessus subsp. massiliense]|uniref:hypothetical protein n=1 Tax=Mycobacteroides abscessus TaxID=36809 RepID=UPI0034D5CDA1